MYKIETLLIENEKLRKENDYLKQVLISNNIKYSFSLIKNQKEMLIEERVKLFMSYFRGREDVFASGYESAKGVGYSTVCKNRFNINLCDPKKYKGCKGCPNKHYYGMSQTEIIEHYKGEKVYGIYPMLEGNMCYFLAVDFDKNDFKEAARTFKEVCCEHDIDCVLEISRSGKGAHAWIFFEEAIKAKDARKLGDHLMFSAFNKNKNISF